MPIEYVTRSMGFDNLIVNVTVRRYICDDCARRECFHDVPPPPYGESHATPTDRGWSILPAWHDGEPGARCPECNKPKIVVSSSKTVTPETRP